MTPTEDDEWAKAREMVRNAPPGTAQTQWNPNELTEVDRPRVFPKKAFFVLLLVVALGGGAYYAFVQRDELFGSSGDIVEKKAGSEASSGPSSAGAPAPLLPAQAKAQPQTTTISIRKGAKGINVRSNPSAGSAVVGRLSGGDRAEKIGESDGWAHLRFEAAGKSVEGWVRADLLAE